MFTGLIEQIGTIRSMRRSGPDAELRIAANFTELSLGESIAVDGACLTVSQIMDDGFVANVSAETLTKTTLQNRKPGEGVHLERALRLGDRMGGHLVSGHVDGIGTKVSMTPVGDAVRTTFEVPEPLAPFIAPKGSVAVDGVSLTVNRASGLQFDLVLVPHTRTHTLFDKRPIGSPVNLEVDLLAKYVARLLGKPGVDGQLPGSGVTLDLLAREGFL